MFLVVLTVAPWLELGNAVFIFLDCWKWLNVVKGFHIFFEHVVAICGYS